MFQRSVSVLSFLLIVKDFLSAFPVQFPIKVLSFCSCSLRKRRFYQRLISLSHRLVLLILRCCSLKYALIFRQFFSVSALTIFQSWFLSDGNLVFFSDKILLNISILIFSSCVSLCSVWFGYVVFRLLLLCGIFRLECSRFSLFGVSIIVFGSCFLIPYLFAGLFLIFQCQKTNPFFMIVLTWSASFWFGS